MDIYRVSKATERLCRFGWLAKVGSGGRSRTCRYELLHAVGKKTVPDSGPVFGDKTVYGSYTVSGDKTVYEPYTKTVHKPYTGIGKKREINRGERQDAENPPPNSQNPSSGSGIQSGDLNPEAKEKKVFSLWEIYRGGYSERYGFDPQPQDKEIEDLLRRVGAEEACRLIKYYLAQDGYYHEQAHPLRLLLSDLDKCRAYMAAGHRVGHRPKKAGSVGGLRDITGIGRKEGR
jgi:hypothetical protein